MIRRILMKTPFVPWLRDWVYYPVRGYVTRRRQARRLALWEKAGRPVPPPHLVKQQVLREYGKRYGLRVLVETGTYRGDMLQAMMDTFDVIYSVELSEVLYEKVRRRFWNRPKVHLFHGDSAVELKNIISELDRPALFWLDGHYSGGVTARGPKRTPIYEELGHVFAAPRNGNVIIIDDARHFGRHPEYPTIPELVDFVRSRVPDVDIAIEDDSIRITPFSPGAHLIR